MRQRPGTTPSSRAVARTPLSCKTVAVGGGLCMVRRTLPALGPIVVVLRYIYGMTAADFYHGTTAMPRCLVRYADGKPPWEGLPSVIK